MLVDFLLLALFLLPTAFAAFLPPFAPLVLFLAADFVAAFLAGAFAGAAAFVTAGGAATVFFAAALLAGAFLAGGAGGVLAVELFETVDGRLLVNELAMRPHNSGHWTMDGARTSQFEQHLRAVLDYPLGDTDATVPVTVMANVLGAAQTPTMTVDERLHHLFARMPDARVHLYGKGERPGRKVGHINFLGDHVAELANLRDRAQLAAHWLSHGQWTDGWDPHG